MYKPHKYEEILNPYHDYRLKDYKQPRSDLSQCYSFERIRIRNSEMLCITVLMFVAFACGSPILDTQIVESTIREVRAVPPLDLLEAATGDRYQDDYSADDDSVGYLKKSQDGGADGYKHFDSFHKKDGDKYGYEKHTSFGTAKKYVDDGENKKKQADKDTAATYHVAEELNEYDDGPSNSEYSGYEGEAGHYEGGEGGHYAEGDSGHYTEGGDADGDGNYSYAKSSSYSSDDGDGEGETAHYEAADGGSDEDY